MNSFTDNFQGFSKTFLEHLTFVLKLGNNKYKRKSLNSKNKMFFVSKSLDCRIRFCFLFCFVFLKFFWPLKVHCLHICKRAIFMERMSPGNRRHSWDFYSLFRGSWSATLPSLSYKTTNWLPWLKRRSHYLTWRKIY